MTETAILTFYHQQSCNDAGFLLADIWAFSFEDLEFHHDFIQWLFPLDTPSAYNPDAPALDSATVRAFRSSPALQTSLRTSLELMLHFYGLELRKQSDSSIVIAPAAIFPQRSGKWLRPNNHNHLRLTRILRSLHLLGLDQESAALRNCLLILAAETLMP